MTDTMTAPTSDLFKQLASLAESAPAGDIMSTGTNLRLISGGRTTFPIESHTGYIEIPEKGLRLTRVTASTRQGDQMVQLRLGFQVRGEVVGVVDESDKANPVDKPFPMYASDSYGSWRTWNHHFRTECLRPQEESLDTLMNLCVAAGWVEWQPRENSRTDYDRTSEILFDLEPPIGEGQDNSIRTRFNNAIVVDSTVVIPDERTDVLKTSYTDGDGNTVTRPGFTGLADTLLPGMDACNRAYAAFRAEQVKPIKDPAKISEARDALRNNLSQLAVLTGQDTESSWPLHPTIGYLTVAGTEIRIISNGPANSASPNMDAAPVTAEIVPDGGDMAEGITPFDVE